MTRIIYQYTFALKFEGFALPSKWFDKALLSEVEGLTTNGLMDYLDATYN